MDSKGGHAEPGDESERDYTFHAFLQSVKVASCTTD
jgi:hypothetical protein